MNIADKDQLQAALRDIAFALREHYLQMIRVGFAPYEALQLTIGFQDSLIRGDQK